MSSRSLFLFVYAENDCDVFILGGSGNDDFLNRATQMFLCIFCLGKESGRFNNDLSSDRCPIDRGWVTWREDSKLLPFDADSVFGRRNLVIEIAEHRIVF